jgi:hypothetical protein
VTDRHKANPKAVRMPDGLLAWYEQHAKDTGQFVNAVLVAALEDYRQRHGGGTTAVVAPAKSRRKPPGKRGSTTPVSGARLQELRAKAFASDVEPVTDPAELSRLSVEAHTAEIAAQTVPEQDTCPHPKARINKGLCGACGTYVGSKP